MARTMGNVCDVSPRGLGTLVQEGRWLKGVRLSGTVWSVKPPHARFLTRQFYPVVPLTASLL